MIGLIRPRWHGDHWKKLRLGFLLTVFRRAESPFEKCVNVWFLVLQGDCLMTKTLNMCPAVPMMWQL